MKKFRFKIQLKFLLPLMVVLGAVLFFLRGYLTYKPFDSSYYFSGASFFGEGVQKNTYIVDGGKKRILVTDPDKKITRSINGGTLKDDFYYAFHVCDDENGNIYVADVIYGEEGGLLDAERVIRLTDKEREILFEHDFKNAEDRPFAYGYITELKNDGEAVYFLWKENGDITRYVMKDGAFTPVETVSSDFDINDAAYDVTTGTYSISTRQGEVYVYRQGSWSLLPLADEEMLPWEVTAANGHLYIAEMEGGTLFAGNLNDEELTVQDYFADEDIFFTRINMQEGSEILRGGDDLGIVEINAETAQAEYFESLPYGFRGMIILTWIILALLVLGALMILSKSFNFVFQAFLAVEDKSAIIRVGMVALTAVAVASAISYTSVISIRDGMIDNTVESLLYVSDCLEKSIEPETIVSIASSLKNRGNEEFTEVKRVVDIVGNASYSRGGYYYIILYSMDEDGAHVAVDFENSYACGQLIYPMGENDTTLAYETKETQINAEEISSFGSYIFVTQPLFDADGNVIAEIEVGANADHLNEQKNQLIFDSICSVLGTSAVVIMFVLEFMFAINFYDKKKRLRAEQHDSTTTVPIRLMVFLIYVTDCMQDAFIALLCERLYEASTGGIARMLPEGIAIALPISLQFMFAAVASVIGGKLISKIGTKKSMTGGLLIQAAGFLLCALFGSSYTMIMVGKILIGLGEGMVYVTANTMAALTSDEENSKQAFTDVSAGVLSGVSIGAGLGATLLSMGEFNLVYFAGAILLLFGVVLSLSAKSYGKEDGKSTAVSEGTAGAQAEAPVKHISFVQFIFNRQVFVFLIFMLLPFMMSLSFRDYFFPLYAGSEGMSEVMIGYIYLLCGVMTLYVGPFLSKFLLHKIGPKKSVLLASVLMGGVMLVYVVFPSLPAVICAVVVFSYIISFAYTCQYSYFEIVPSVMKYGEGSSMGVYSMIESLGQTLGPVVFGALLALGRRQGLSIAAGAMLVFSLIYALTRQEKK